MTNIDAKNKIYRQRKINYRRKDHLGRKKAGNQQKRKEHLERKKTDHKRMKNKIENKNKEYLK